MKIKIFIFVFAFYFFISLGTIIFLLFNSDNSHQTINKNYNNLNTCYKYVNLKHEISIKINCTNYNIITNECEGIYANITKFNYQDELKKCYELYK